MSPDPVGSRAARSDLTAVGTSRGEAARVLAAMERVRDELAAVHVVLDAYVVRLQAAAREDVAPER